MFDPSAMSRQCQTLFDRDKLSFRRLIVSSSWPSASCLSLGTCMLPTSEVKKHGGQAITEAGS